MLFRGTTVNLSFKKVLPSLFLLPVIMFLPHSASASTTTFSERQKKYELVAQNIKIDEAKTKANCKQNQIAVKSYYDRAQRVKTSRGLLYNQHIARLGDLLERQRKKGQSLGQLESAYKQYESRVEVFRQKQTAYVDILSDLQVISCITNPKAYVGAVTELKTATKEVILASEEVRTYGVDTVQKVLKDIKSE
jgi:hypothetical protein